MFLILALLLTAAPMTAYAQDDPVPENCEGSGVFYWPCRLIDGIFSAISGFFNFILNTVSGFIQFIGEVFNWVITAIGNIVSFIGDILRLAWDLITGVIELIVEVLEIVGLLIQIIVRIVMRLGQWIFEIAGLVVGIFFSFFSATPTPLPGLPECISAPTAHEICGIWYLFDNTVFSGSPGDMIALMLVIIVDIILVFLFGRTVLGMIQRGESVTDVG